jgi:hypothetical protein
VKCCVGNIAHGTVCLGKFRIAQQVEKFARLCGTRKIKTACSQVIFDLSHLNPPIQYCLKTVLIISQAVHSLQICTQMFSN